MQRSFRNRTILCLIPTLIALALVVKAYFKDPEGLSGFKRGIDLSGGTILVYEVDQELSKQSQGGGSSGGPRAKADTALADSLKRRIDPADLLGVVIRPLGDSRVEIILPYGTRSGSGKEAINVGEVDKIKSLIREVGSLEFRILANPDDDDKAIADAKAFFDRGRESADNDEAKALDSSARAGSPPLFPNKPAGDVSEYIVMNEPVQYAWVELGKNQRAEMGLSTASPGPTKRAGRDEVALFPVFEQARSAGTFVPYGRNIYWSRESKNEKDTKTRDQKKFEYFVLCRISDKDRLMVGGDVSITASIEQGSSMEPVIGFAFNGRGGSRFFDMTSRNKPTGPDSSQVSRQLGIILDGYLISSANIKTAIRDRGVIEGNFERPYVERIVSLLRSGALPATLKPLPVSENTIGPTLGADTIKSGTMSIVLAFSAVLIFMMVYYRFAGLVATVALLANLLLTVGFMLAVNATFTLPGLAGLVLMLGMAVDANVLIYERVREERDRGMNLPTALRNGYDRALPTIIDTHLSSIFTAIVLYTVGNDQLKGFGVSLTVGLIISLFTSLYMTRLIFDFWQAKNWLKQLRMLRFFTRPNIDFMKLRYAMFTFTGVLTVLGITLFLMRGQQGLNVDFVGGTAYSGRLVQAVDIGKLRNLVSEGHQKDRLKVVDVQETIDPTGRTKNTFEISYEGGQKTIVTLANPPEGSSAEARATNVKERASKLKDLSVEQIFPGGSASSTSQLFTIRTTERERELVEAAMSRLFQEADGKALLAKNEILAVDAIKNSNDFSLKFKDPISKTTVKTLFERQFQTKIGDQSSASDVFDIIEMGEPEDGRYREMKLVILKDANEGIRNLLAEKDGLAGVITAAKKEIGNRPQPERLETFDGTLASETRSRALYAIIASWGAILLYLWFRFGNWTFGAAAVICLIHDLCFALGAIALCHYLGDTMLGQLLGLKDFKIDLPAVAALLTLVGYSVNDTIVVFDRIKEVRGKSATLTSQMINDSVNQTLSRTLLASLTTFLVVSVLYIFGGEGVHLFAFVMVVGVVIGTYSSIYVASPLLLIFGEGKVRGTVPSSGSAPVTA
ncbi:MAG: protein translocase subunit SecD [Gemmataceae bacterium]|nr:protein translocase subunit SecD [Gemmataceae bacterium]